MTESVAGAGDNTVDRPGLVLLVDDEPLFLRALVRMLRPERHRLLTAQTADQATAALADPALEVVLLDLQLGSESGIDLLERVKRERPEVEVVMLTGDANVDNVVRCMRSGALDYLQKPVEDAHRLRNAVRRAIERRRLLDRTQQLERALADHEVAPLLIGQSEAMRSVVRTIESLHRNESTVLVRGESGTGKELVAAAIHLNSPRSGGAFVPVDCGALPESIIDSELFGHEKGAFTGAVGAPGLFRMAEGGTLFLDEIGELPPATQARLLRALQEREVRPVGSARSIPVDLRIVAATHRDLAGMVREGTFRQDLFFRLDVVQIELPPLRDRREDIPLLVEHFLRKHVRPGGRLLALEPDALDPLMAHDWPGNVRELENAIESAIALCAGERLRASDFAIGNERAARHRALPADLPLSLAAYERCVIERALSESAGDATRAAAKLGIGRSTFYRKLTKHGLSARPGAAPAASAGGPAAIR